jgi:hypothetical protein
MAFREKQFLRRLFPHGCPEMKSQSPIQPPMAAPFPQSQVCRHNRASRAKLRIASMAQSRVIPSCHPWHEPSMTYFLLPSSLALRLPGLVSPVPKPTPHGTSHDTTPGFLTPDPRSARARHWGGSATCFCGEVAATVFFCIYLRHRSLRRRPCPSPPEVGGAPLLADMREAFHPSSNPIVWLSTDPGPV